MRDGPSREPVKLQVKVDTLLVVMVQLLSNCIGGFMAIYFLIHNQLIFSSNHYIAPVFNRVCLTKLTMAMTMVSASVAHMSVGIETHIEICEHENSCVDPITDNLMTSLISSYIMTHYLHTGSL